MKFELEQYNDSVYLVHWDEPGNDIVFDLYEDGTAVMNVGARIGNDEMLPIDLVAELRALVLDDDD